MKTIVAATLIAVSTFIGSSVSIDGLAAAISRQSNQVPDLLYDWGRVTGLDGSKITLKTDLGQLKFALSSEAAKNLSQSSVGQDALLAYNQVGEEAVATRVVLGVTRGQAENGIARREWFKKHQKHQEAAKAAFNVTMLNEGKECASAYLR